MKTDAQRKHESFLSVKNMHLDGKDPHIIKGRIGFTYAGAFAVWSVLKNGIWTACSHKPKTTETRTTMELV
jgi:hypothetical protein